MFKLKSYIALEESNSANNLINNDSLVHSYTKAFNKSFLSLYYIRNKNENSLSKNFDEFYKYFLLFKLNLNMALEESKSENNITDIGNLVNSYTKDFKKFFHSLKYNKNKNTLRKNKTYNKNNPDMPKRQSKSIIWEQKSKYNTIHKDSNPIEFFYEFQEFIGRD